MTNRILTALAATTLLAAPALAQAPANTTAPVAATAEQGAATAAPGKHQHKMHEKRNTHRASWQAISPEGRAILKDSWKQGDKKAFEEMRAARENVRTLMAADKLDIPALKKAMDTQKKLQDNQHATRQQRLLETLPKLSTADRKALTAAMNRGPDKFAQADRKADLKKADERRAEGALGATTPAPAAATQQ